MASFLNVCRFTAASSGTGSFVVSTAVTGYQTPASANAVDGATYRYRAESADLSQWEVGYGVYTAGTATLTRGTILFNSSGGASAINFTAAPQVAIVQLAEDIIFPPTSTTDKAALRANGTGGRTYQNSALIIADTTGALSRSGGGGIPVQGSNTNSSPAAGDIGETITSAVAIVSGVGLTNSVAKDITSIALTAGNWNISGVGYFQNASGATGVTSIETDISPTSNTVPSTQGAWNQLIPASSTLSAISGTAVGPYRVSLSASATYYLVALAVFSSAANSVKASGYIQAVRLP